MAARTRGGRRSPSPAKAGADETGRTTRTSSSWPVSKKRPYWRSHQKTIIEWCEQELREAEIEGRPFKELFLIRDLIKIAKLAPLPPGQQRKDPTQAFYEEWDIQQARIWRDRQVERGMPRKKATHLAVKKAAAATGKAEETVRRLLQSPQVREIARLVLLAEKRQREKVLKRVAALLPKTRNE
jgi:hypothetical protein